MSDAYYTAASIAAFKAAARYRLPYKDAVMRRPAGECYCNLDGIDCYEAGHWEPVEFPDNGPDESF